MLSHETAWEVSFEELSGQDLTGKVLERELMTLEGKVVLSTDKAVSIILESSSPKNYRILFPKEYEECYAKQCSHLNEETSPSECFKDKFQEYTFAPWAKITIKELVPVKEEVTVKKEQSMDNNVTGRYEVIMRETNRILPELFRKMIGSGGVSLDTDSMSLADPRDRHHLEWLARITAGFVLEEQAVWEPQVNECLTKIEKDTRRMGDLDRLLGQLREAAAGEDVTGDELKELISKYRDPLENHYDLMREKRDKAKLMDELAASIMEKPKSAEDTTN